MIVLTTSLTFTLHTLHNQKLVASTVVLIAAFLPTVLSSTQDNGSNEPPAVLLPVVDSCNHEGKQPNGELTWQPVNRKFSVKAQYVIDQGQEVGTVPSPLEISMLLFPSPSPPPPPSPPPSSSSSSSPPPFLPHPFLGMPIVWQEGQ